MKITLLLIFALSAINVFGQDEAIGFKYSFEIEIPNEDLEAGMKKNLESKISKSFKVYYTDKGVLRHIEKPNNFIQSSIFDNEKNELIIFDNNGVVSKESGSYNQPEIMGVDSDSVGVVVFTTTTGIYNYFYDSTNAKLISSNYSNLGEHCFYEFIKITGVVPERIVFEMGIMNFVMNIENPIQLTADEAIQLNEIISNPDADQIKIFVNFSEGK